MARRLMQAGVVLVVVLVAAQFIRPNQTNPPIDQARTIAAYEDAGSPLVGILDRSCSDCHSNAAASGWHTQIAPFSWLMAAGVSEARRAVNYSDWGGYSPDRQRALLGQTCQDVSSGKMPSIYTWLRPETRLSPSDIETVCAAARQASASAAEGSR